MTEHIPRSGRNCSFFPIARGRFDSLLKMKEEYSGITFYMPPRFHIGNVFWRMFFIYFFIFMIAVAVITLAVNNGGLDIASLIEHPQRDYYLAAAAAVIILPYLLAMILAFLKPHPVLEIDRLKQVIKAGYMRRGEWKSVVHEYRFVDLGAIEVLRNYEIHGRGYIGRSGRGDSYELNLYFHTDGLWLGISESTMRPKILEQASLVSGLTRVPYLENNERGYSPAAAAAEAVSEGRDEPPDAFNDLPPFVRARIGEPVHSIEVNSGKLRRKLLPFSFRLSDDAGRQFTALIMPVVSHFVNRVGYDKSLAAFEYMCSDRDDPDRRERLRLLFDAGWRGEDELLATLSRVYDAATGPVPGLLANRDAFERYYMTLQDDIQVPVLKYRIIFFELLEEVIRGYPDRIDKYERDPGSLNKIQNSENYALRFMIGLGFGAVIVVFGFFSGISLLFAYRAGGPEAFLGAAILSAITIALIWLRHRLRKKFGGR